MEVVKPSNFLLVTSLNLCCSSEISTDYMQLSFSAFEANAGTPSREFFSRLSPTSASRKESEYASGERCVHLHRMNARRRSKTSNERDFERNLSD